MKRTRNLGWRIGSGLGCLVVFACGAKVDVLNSDKGTLDGQNGDGVSHWEDCQPTELEVRALTGDTCGFAPPQGCGDLCSSCYVEYECSGRNFACDASGVLRVTETTALDCGIGPAPYPNGNPNAFWSDCMQALENGSGGDSCQGTWLCARPTQEDCCIEVAQCSSLTRSIQGGQALGRYRVCSDGCRALEPRPELPGPSSCADGETGPLEAGIPCAAGGYICAGRHDVSQTPLVTSDAPPTTLHWCGHGVVQTVTDFGNHGL